MVVLTGCIRFNASLILRDSSILARSNFLARSSLRKFDPYFSFQTLPDGPPCSPAVACSICSILDRLPGRQTGAQ
jgi:hypothetical protein